LTISKPISEASDPLFGANRDVAAPAEHDLRHPAGQQTIPVDDADLVQLRDLYERSLNLQVWQLVQRIGPLQRWGGTEARIMAGRLANNLGGQRLGRVLHIRAWQQDPSHPTATSYYARVLFERKGPYATWRFVKSVGEMPEAPVDVRADWLAFAATVAATLRDFSTAETLVARAIELSERRQPWIFVERSYVLLQQDRHEEALDVARRALGLNPVFRPAIQAAAQVLAHLNRDDEAMQLLRDAAARTESAPILTHLATMLGEAKLYDEARQTWEKVVEASPLADRDFKRFLAGRRSDLMYRLGDLPAAASFAKEAGPGFFATIAERLSRPDLPEQGRIELPVPFVQQHHMTCAPATLAALCRFWGRPAEHLEIVEAICYDGTPAHSERSWAEGQGFVCREFRVTWESACALIDRGVPFTLTTTATTSAHLQAVIGYDARRGTLVLRDPSWKFSGEALADGLLDHQKSTGPRGMAMVPREEAHRLVGLDLPEADFYDDFHRVQTALVTHRRSDAVAACAAMEARDANHRLTLWARRSIATYDADPVAQLRATEALQALYPDDASLRLHRVSLLRNLARRSDILDALARAAADAKADPIFLQQYAQELAADPREVPRAERLLRKCLRLRGEAATHFILANVLWGRREMEEALELYRFATCLDDKDDQFAGVWFGASRHFRRTDEALAMFRDRFERFGGRSSGPARTLFRALLSVDRTAEAFEVLEQGLTRRPDDPDLLLHGADAYVRYGNAGRAADLIDRAKGRAHPAAFQRALATLANYRGELAEALAHWRTILESEPLAQDAHQNVAQLLAETEGREAALEHLRQAAERFEHHYPLHQTWIGWLRGDDPARLEPVLRRLLEHRPADAWLVRELAICLTRLGRAADAVATAEEALRLEPTNTSSHSVAARAYALANRPADAKSATREAIRLSVDNDDAIELWAELCATVEERRAAIAYVCEQLVAQTTFGDGLLAFRQWAAATLDGEEVLRTLSEALDARPDLWHAWSAKARQLAEMNRIAEAVEVLQTAVQRFPLHPRLWLDLASLQAFAGDAAGEQRSLGKALEIAPGWGPAVRQLADALGREGRFDEAARHLRSAINWAPLDPFNYASLAEVLWKTGQRDAAVEQMRKAVQLAPRYDWAWTMLRAWGAELERPETAVDAARELVARRGGEARSWYTLARTLDGDAALDERLAALDRAITLEPLEVDYHDYRAFLLARHGRFDDALAACAPAAFSSPPARLRGRTAWIRAHQGDLEQAITLMRAVCDDEPRYNWGWTMLCEWHRDANQHEGYLHAARQLTRIAPLEAPPWGFLGEACERNRDAKGAAEAYRRAFEIDPGYTFAGFGLFDLQLSAGDLDDAARTLDRIAPHERGPLVVARRVQLASRRRDPVAVADAMRDLCATPGVEPFHLKAAADAMTDAKFGRLAEDVLHQAMCAPGQNSWAPGPTAWAAGVEWVRRLAARERFRDIERALAKFLATHAGTDSAAAEDRQAHARAIGRYLQALGEGRHSLRLRRFLRRHAERLRRDPLTWGTAAAAMLDNFAYRRAIRWMDGWTDRPGVQQWMVTNLAQCHHALGDYDQSARLARAALEPRFADGGSPWPHLLLAIDAAEAGRFDDAERHAAIAGRSADQMDPDARFAHAALQAMLESARTTGPNPKTTAAASFARARVALARLQSRFPKFRRNPGHRRFFRRAARSIARQRGTLWARLWLATRLIDSGTRLQ
jgi:tetratricopeptide (TPR) repeat protein